MKTKAQAIERSVIDLINSFVEVTDVSEVDEYGRRKFMLPPEQIDESNWRVEHPKPIDKYDWISFEKISKVVSFPSAEDMEVLVFKDWDVLKLDVTLLHIDCMELFAYYNQRFMSSLIRCTRSSMEELRDRSGFNTDEPEKANENSPLFLTKMYLEVPSCVLQPSLSEINKDYANIVKNIAETNYGITTWGRLAKTPARSKMKPQIDEVRHPKNYYKLIWDHKEIQTLRSYFEGGLFHCNKPITDLTSSLYNTYAYLWSETRTDSIKSFLEPKTDITAWYKVKEEERLVVDIRDRFREYDIITNNIDNIDRRKRIKCIEIDLQPVVTSILDESRQWKNLLADGLRMQNKVVMDDIVEFITDHMKTLNRPLKDLDDVRMAMKCLDEVSVVFYQYDMRIAEIEEKYALLLKFEVQIPSEEMERVDTLRYSFGNMMTMVRFFIHFQINSLSKFCRQETCISKY